jgi:hypothetical protein
MNPQIQINLALILFLPWYLILAWLYWAFPRQPRTALRRLFDLASLAFTVLASAASMHWSYLVAAADASAGPIWRQILATSVSYGVFLAALTAAFAVRRRWVIAPQRASGAPASPHTNRSGHIP